jgi:hypothetical protein
MGAHATRSASGNKRWMNCPGSIRMSEGRPNESSGAARLGTAAHGLGEYCLRNGVWPVDMLGGEVYLDEHEDAFVFTPDTIRQLNSNETIAVPAKIIQLVAAGHEAFPIDANMADAVQVYVAVVREEMEQRPDAELMVEHRSNLSWLVGYDWPDDAPLDYVSPNGLHMKDMGDGEYVLCNKGGTRSAGPMFGTNDAAVLQLFEHLTVFDYKHGQGVLVEVSEYVPLAGCPGAEGLRGNSQEMQYALGIAHDVEWAFETLDLVIVQPRARHADGGVRRYSTTKAELLLFEDELRQAAQRVEEPDAPLAAGSWCQFCPAAGIPCPELHASVIRIAQVDFSDGEPQVEHIDEGTPDAKLEEAMAVVPLLDTYIKAIRSEAMRRLRESTDGTGFGYKLVRGKSNRAWQDQATVVEQLVAKGFPKADLYEAPKLKSPSKVEALRPAELVASLKASGVKAPVGALKAIVAEFAHKPEGKVVVARMDDPRDAVAPATAAAADFEAVEEE